MDLDHKLQHVLMVKHLIYELLLCCHKLQKIFQAFEGFSGSFNKLDQVNGSAKQCMTRQTIHLNTITVTETIQPM